MSFERTRPGDIDGDGQITQSDLALLRQILNEGGSELLEQLSPEERARLDINGDGCITQADVVRLCELMMQAGQTNLPALNEKLATLRNKFRAQ